MQTTCSQAIDLSEHNECNLPAEKHTYQIGRPALFHLRVHRFPQSSKLARAQGRHQVPGIVHTILVLRGKPHLSLIHLAFLE